MAKNTYTNDLDSAYSATLYSRTNADLDNRTKYWQDMINQRDELNKVAESQTPQKKPSFWGELGSAVWGGVVKDNVADLLYLGKSIDRWLDDAGKQLIGTGLAINPSKMFSTPEQWNAYLNTTREDQNWSVAGPENKTGWGNTTRAILNFASLFIPISGEAKASTMGVQAERWGTAIERSIPKAMDFFINTGKGEMKLEQGLNAAQTVETAGKMIAGKLVKETPNMVASAAITAIRDPYQERLSNFIQDNPSMQNPITEYLAADPKDGEAEARFKNVLEDMGLGIMIDGVFMLAKMVKTRQIVKETIPNGEKVIEDMDKYFAENGQGKLFDTPDPTKEEIDAFLKGDQEIPSPVSDKLANQLDFNFPSKGELPGGVSSDAVDKLAIIDPNGYSVLPDLTGRDPLELADMRDFAAGQGVDGATEYLRKIKDLSTSIDEGDSDNIIKTLDAINGESGFASVGALTPLLGGGTGALVGSKVDVNRDGKIDFSDVALGALFGAGITVAGMKGFEIAGKSDIMKNFKTLKDEKLQVLSDTEEKLKKLLTSTKDPANVQKLSKDLDNVKQLSSSIKQIDSVESVKQLAKDPETLKRIERRLTPVVKVMSDQADKIVQHIQNNTLKDAIEVDWKAITSESAIQNLNDSVYKIVQEQLNKAGSGVVKGFDHTRALANELGISVDTVNTAFANKAKDLHGYALAARVTLDKSREVLLQRTQEALKAGDNSAKTLLELRHLAATHASLRAEVEGTKSEIGRALNSLKILPNSGHLDMEEYEALLNEFGGREGNMKALQKLKELSTPQEQSIFIKSLGNSRSLNALSEWFYGALLSNPATWVANGLSGIFTTANALAETKIASMMGKTGVLPGETEAMWGGMLDGFQDAIRIAHQTFRDGRSVYDPLTKIGASVENAISGEGFDRNKMGAVASALDYLGHAVRFGGRVLAAEDDFWKVINERMAIHRGSYIRALEIAQSEGVTGDRLLRRVADVKNQLVSSPTTELINSSRHFAREQTFNLQLDPNQHLFTAAGEAVQHGIQNIPALRMFIPFVRTPVNIATYVAERTPGLNLLSKRAWDIISHGTETEKQTMIAKMTLGAGMYSVGFALASNGLITGGGGKSTGDEAVAGRQAYSVKIGDKYFSYNRLDPLGAFFGISADLHDLFTSQDYEDDGMMSKLIQGSTLTLVKNLSSKQYLMGLSEVISALTSNDPGSTKWNKIAQNTLGALVPSFVSSIERGLNPTYSETATDHTNEFTEMFSLLNAAKSKVPGLSDTLPPKRDLFGDEVKAKGWSWGSIFNPLTYGEEEQDPVKKLVADLNIDPKGILSNMHIIDGVQLSPQQFDQYLQTMGAPLKERIQKMADSARFQNSSKDRQADMVRNIIFDSKAYAKSKFLRDNRDVWEQIRELKRASSD